MKNSQALFLDVDGTLVDSVYNHIWAWSKAFNQTGYQIPKFEIHKLIGMGSDKLIPRIAGNISREKLVKITSLHNEYYSQQINSIKLLPFAREFIAKAKEEGFEIILVSSARFHEIEHYSKLLEDNFKVISSDDVRETKPNPEIFIKALDGTFNSGSVIVMGDSVWDIKAANAAKIKSIAFLTGGFCEGELKKAGALRVYKDLRIAYEKFEEITSFVQGPGFESKGLDPRD